MYNVRCQYKGQYESMDIPPRYEEIEAGDGINNCTGPYGVAPSTSFYLARLTGLH